MLVNGFGGRIVGQKPPLLPKQVWAIRARLELAGYLRALVLFNVAIDSKLRGCDLVKLSVFDRVKDDRVRKRVSAVQSKTKRPVQFEVTENSRETVLAWVKPPEMFPYRFMLLSRFHNRSHIPTRNVFDCCARERLALFTVFFVQRFECYAKDPKQDGHDQRQPTEERKRHIGDGRNTKR